MEKDLLYVFFLKDFEKRITPATQRGDKEEAKIQTSAAAGRFYGNLCKTASQYQVEGILVPCIWNNHQVLSPQLEGDEEERW